MRRTGWIFRVGMLLAAIAATCWNAPSYAQGVPDATRAEPVRVAYTRTSSPLGATRTLSYDIPLAPRQTLRLHAGYDAFASFPEDANLEAFGRPTMKLRSVPVGVDYVLHLADPQRRIVPIVSAGASLAASRLSVMQPEGASAVETPKAAADQPFAAFSPATHKASRMGMGYEVHAAIGLRANVNEHVFVLGQARLRHLDALGFSRGDLAAFNKLDFAVGVGFKL